MEWQYQTVIQLHKIVKQRWLTHSITYFLYRSFRHVSFRIKNEIPFSRHIIYHIIGDLCLWCKIILIKTDQLSCNTILGSSVMEFCLNKEKNVPGMCTPWTRWTSILYQYIQNIWLMELNGTLKCAYFILKYAIF